MTDREKVISKLEKEAQRTYSTKTTVFQNGEKVSEEINTHREPCVRIPIEMADEILAMLKEQEAKPVEVCGQMFTIKYGHCPTCGKGMGSDKYPHWCGFCGQAVKWE